MSGTRRPVVAGNWKMFKCQADAAALARAVLAQAATAAPAVEIVICPPFTALKTVSDELKAGPVGLGAQNMHWEKEGAFTGEVSPPMLADAGCGYVILGHSERRTLFHETDVMVNLKTHAALAAGLTPIVCIGETLAEREADQTTEVLARQLAGSLERVGTELSRVIVAYEPVWAIGTGRTATPEQAQQAHAFIRGRLADMGGAEAAVAVRILYGGSVKPANAVELFGQTDIDGGLIGGAALDAGAFLAIINAAR